MGLGPTKQDDWGQARSIKLHVCHPGSEQYWRKSLGFSHRGEGPRGNLAPCMATPMVDSHTGGLTHRVDVWWCLRQAMAKH